MIPATFASSRPWLALLSGLALLDMGCSSQGSGALSHTQANEEIPKVPMPAADGPKLTALRDATPIYERPSLEGRKLGELRLGATIARSREPYGTSGCDKGWYAVRPRGFVCAGIWASPEPVLTAALPIGPDLNRPLPYRYARARAEAVPLYGRAPTPAEQLATEPDLGKALGREFDKSPLGTSANDVPLDPRGVPTGPPVLLPSGEGMDGGKRTVASYFVFASDSAPPPLPATELSAGLLRKGSGVALAGAFVTESGSGPRRFGVTVEGRIVPVDRLRPMLGSPWHGLDLEKVGLPIAFVHRVGVHTFSFQRGKAEKRDEELERKSAVPLTGKFRTVDGVRYEETRDGNWLRAQDLIVVIKRHKFPDFVKGAQKWLDVSIANQTLTAYEGTKPVYATLVSTGRDQLKDPATSASTARGTFHILGKHVTKALDPREVQNGFDVGDAPWVMDFDPGSSLTGTYWSDLVGEAQGFHDVAMTPIDAHRIWEWSDPQVPEGWHSVYDPSGETTIVSVRP